MNGACFYAGKQERSEGDPESLLAGNCLTRASAGVSVVPGTECPPAPGAYGSRRKAGQAEELQTDVK